MIRQASLVRYLLLAALLLTLPVYSHAGLYPEMRPPQVVWVEEGKALATLVAQAPEKGSSAAAELNQWIRRMTGVELPVTAAPPPTGPRVILGGQAAWERLGVAPDELGLGEEGYVIRTVGDDLVIAGKSNLATLFGVYALLEHYLDCRWFWPGETGVYAPQRATLRIGQIEEISRPDMSIRWIIREPACARFNRLNVGLREPDEFNLHGFVHTYTQLVEPSRYWRDHPEFYAEVGGKRADPTRKDARVNLCTTNPQVVEALVRKIDEIMAADPSINMISVDPMDTQQFCQCEDCRKLQDAEAAGPMRRYHQRLETSVEQSGLHIAMQQAFRTMYQFFTPELEAALAADLEAAQKAVRDPDAARRVELAARGFHYATLVAAYLRSIAQRQERRENQPPWMAADAGALSELEDACAPQVAAIKQFILARENAGASPGMGPYEERLLTPKTVVQGWHRRSDRPDQRTKLLEKSQWLQSHAQKLLSEPPKRLSLWIYGNDFDWQAAAGPEHAVLVRSRDGDNVVLDKIGRKDRNGNGKNLAFILRAIDPSRLDLKPLQVTVENLPGGPTSSAVFAIYLMPDHATTEDEATRLIEHDLEAVRCRAAAFVEFGPFGEASRDNVPVRAELAIPGYPEEAFRP